MLKKFLMLVLSLTCFMCLYFLNTECEAKEIKFDVLTSDVSYDLNSNFFTQEEVIDDVHSKPIDYFLDVNNFKDENGNVLRMYSLVAENGKLALYLSEESLNIAVLVKETGYVFYTNPSYNQWDIEAYYITGQLSSITSTIPQDGMYKTSISESSSPILKVSYIDDGFKCAFNYDKLGISYNLYVTIDDSRLNVSLPSDEIVEVPFIEKKTGFKRDENGNLVKDENGKYVQEIVETEHNFLIKSLTFFQYLGSSFMEEDDTWLNGYIFIPDGSGALIRYQNQSIFRSAYVKNVYGDDKGIDDTLQSTRFLKEEATLTMPIFGVCHGVGKNAFLTVIEEGDSNATLEVRPYGYNNQNLETAFYKFNFRQSYNIKVATSQTGTISSLNAEKYSGSIKYSYNFLTGDQSSYLGMAKCYKDNYLELVDRVEGDKSPINLKVLAMDYKKGLFGKNYIALTKYNELLDIIKELESNEVNEFDIEYIGMYRGGNFSGVIKPRIAYKLGSKKDYNTLINYISNNGYSISAYLDPSVTYKESSRGITKKINLSTFKTDSYGDLFDNAYVLNYQNLSKSITKYNNKFSKFGIDSLTIERIGSNLSSYRYKNRNYYREDSKAQITGELEKLAEYYGLGLYKANSYTFNYLSKYYDMYIESNSYTFITDSVPFVSLLLSGYSELYSSVINYTDDYELNALRLIEYNIYPSFIISKEESSLLRYTNFESKYACEYDRWKNIIIDYYKLVSNTLDSVRGAKMVSHKVLSSGVVLVSYSNNKAIIINYTDSNYVYNTLTVTPKSVEVLDL